VSDVGVKVRFGILSVDLPFRVLARRLLNRVLFRVADTAPVHWALRAMGAERGTRSRISDLYYYLVFRRGIFQGARQARAAAVRVDAAIRRPLEPQAQPREMQR
jgi:hypothetical protein